MINVYLTIGIFVTSIIATIAWSSYFRNPKYVGEIDIKERKTFVGRLCNTTPHTFREIRYGFPNEGDLVPGGGKPENDCAVLPHHAHESDRQFMRLICELVK